MDKTANCLVAHLNIDHTNVCLEQPGSTAVLLLGLLEMLDQKREMTDDIEDSEVEFTGRASIASAARPEDGDLLLDFLAVRP